MVEIQYQCADCNKETKARVGQVIINSKLRWSLSYICNNGKSAVEMDHLGFPDTEQKILLEEGEWQLEVNSVELENKLKSIEIVRQAFNLSIKDASKLSKEFPKIISGTKVKI